jgi:hypothetical protein
MEGRIGIKIVLGVLVCVAIMLGVTAYIVIFGAGTQVVQPSSLAGSASGTPPFVFPSSTASSSPFLGNNTTSSNASGTASSTFSSNFSAPYSVTWSEGQSSFAVAGATLAGDELTLMVNVAVGAIPQCIPINVRFISDEQGDMAAPTSPADTNFPLSTSTCEGTANTTYPSEPLTFTVDPANMPLLFTTGGTSNIYFEVATTTGGLDVSIPQQSG